MECSSRIRLFPNIGSQIRIRNTGKNVLFPFFLLVGRAKTFQLKKKV
jgi:hypothetical protein